ncbi:MAG: hypothetical protein QNJ58_20290 [Desulfobacterales bacterium]|nr:hypothetical protein [Desulfobacterales bacterium]
MSWANEGSASASTIIGVHAPLLLSSALCHLLSDRCHLSSET